ncbi:hypothetical protein GYH30_039880 [Glycine max]|uniref:Bidirectional sugar transporter SWEET n=2 Tax=Glycine subgen. Soja TaxID=1462606 RepID=K7M6L6_SOYBN|nr:hypothetical protein GYH30_039880 [Glycine max]RZB41234.1 Bidirectional sugar transporter NEC1 [Glycine soja]
MVSFSDHELVLIFGLLGNIVSFMVFLAPLSNFYTIYKKKSSEGFQSIPYVVALLSALLLLYYDFIKTKATLIITINCIGCVIEVLYLTMYIIYAPRKQKAINRVHAVGWSCAIFNIAVFVAPLSIMLHSIFNYSLFMPFSLSLFLTLCAIMWFLYGFFDKDDFIMGAANTAMLSDANEVKN